MSQKNSRGETLETVRANARKWYAGNRGAVRKYKLKTRYNITETEYDTLLQKQAGLCAICRHPPEGIRRDWMLHIDHDHKTGEVRGLLCDNCNRGIGLFQESVSNLEAATEYLKAYWRGYLKL